MGGEERKEMKSLRMLFCHFNLVFVSFFFFFNTNETPCLSSSLEHNMTSPDIWPVEARGEREDTDFYMQCHFPIPADPTSMGKKDTPSPFPSD